jgi:GAF domain-containing protein
MKKRRSMTTGPKRRNAPKAVRRRSSSPAGRETKLARLTRELHEAAEQQTATSEILGVISRSPSDLQPVFDAIVQSAARLCDASNASLYRVEGNMLRHVANYGRVSIFKPGEARPITSRSLSGIAVIGRKVVHIHDALAVADTELRDNRIGIERERIRTVLAIPLLRGDATLGVFLARRDVVRDFTDKQIELLTNFAAQAVIAIENARLLNELRQRTDDLSEALEQADRDVRGVARHQQFAGRAGAGVSSDAENATHICEAEFGNLFLYENDAYRAVAIHNAPPAYANARKQGLIRPGPTTGLGRLALNKQVAQIADMKAEQAYVERDPFVVAGVELAGIRTLLAVPMIKDGELVGAIAIYRKEVRPFTDKQVALVKHGCLSPY